MAELYKYRDHYFENHSIEDAHKKTSDVQLFLEEQTLPILDKLKGTHEIYRKRFTFAGNQQTLPVLCLHK